MAGIGASVKTLSQNEGFSLGKAHESVFSLPNPSLYPQPNQPHTKLSTIPQTTLQQHQHYYNTSQPCYFLHSTTRHNTNDLKALKHCDRQDFNT